MLQQTQVDTVIPYYKRWIKNFPHLTKLVRAPLSRVLKNWEGLGYYRRARNLHQTAKIVANQLGGKFPDSREELQKLPGIGRYTAGAIASISFDQPEPILDGNVKRVLSRLFALREPIDKAEGEKKLWEIAQSLVKGTKRPGDFNQALMELGALVCLPENPECFICPIKKICKAHGMKREDEFPVKARKEKIEKLRTVAAVIWKKGRVLLGKQPLEARWGGLWIFPQWIHRNGESGKDFLEKKVREELGIRIQGLRSRTKIEHGFTKYRVELHVYEGEENRDGSIFTNKTKNRTVSLLRWVHPGNLSHLPLPRPHQKIAREIANHA